MIPTDPYLAIIDDDACLTWASRAAADEHRRSVAAARAAILGAVLGARRKLGKRIERVNRRSREIAGLIRVRSIERAPGDDRPPVASRDIVHAITPTRGGPARPALSLGPPLRA